MAMSIQPDAASNTSESSSSIDPRRRVVIRYATGTLLRGFLAVEDEARLPTNESARLLVEKPEGELVAVEPSEIKAVFFVRSFEGSPDYSEFKVFPAPPNGKGVWVRVHFLDGEVMEGIAPNCLDTYAKPIFYMTPPDPASNNQAVLLSKRFLKEMQVLGLAAD